MPPRDTAFMTSIRGSGKRVGGISESLGSDTMRASAIISCQLRLSPDKHTSTAESSHDLHALGRRSEKLYRKGTHEIRDSRSSRGSQRDPNDGNHRPRMPKTAPGASAQIVAIRCARASY